MRNGDIGSTSRAQAGVSLPMALVMLVTLSILVVSMMNQSNSQWKTMSNVQIRGNTEAAAKEALNIVISGQDLFNAVLASSTVSGGVDGITPSSLSTHLTKLPVGCLSTSDGCLSVGSDPDNGKTVMRGKVNGYTVSVSLPFCYGARPAAGYSVTSTVSPEDTHWELTSVATDPISGASATYTRAVKMRMGAGNCGNLIN